MKKKKMFLHRRIQVGFVSISMAAFLAGCGQSAENATEAVDIAIQETLQTKDAQEEVAPIDEVSIDGVSIDGVQISLSDDMITVDGEAASTETSAAVYTANDIVYYEEGKDFTYGEGTEEDAHSREEADSHTVVHITQPGTYVLSGNLSAGQIAVDLGEEAEEDPEAVVTLVLNGVDIHCSVAPAVIFYQVYECGTKDEETATKDVDTSAAGANVVIADDTENNISGSYVARIYESVELSEDGTEVVDSKKLHKYDAAFYSKMSMNIDGGEVGSGVLNIMAENEGLDSELHLSLNGGNVNITSGNDGINTNEDGISVTTVNGGNLNITVNGATGEGDGIDSNGWLVINGGTVIASACDFSADAGIDSDMGIHINGGTVIATGNMLDHIAEGTQNYAVFSFASKQNGGADYSLKNADDTVIAEATPENDFSYLIFSTAYMAEGTYSLWTGDAQMAGSTGIAMMAGAPAVGSMAEMPEGMEVPEGGEMPEGMERPEGGEMPEGMERPEGGEMPEGMERPEGGEMPEGMERPEGGEMPEGMERPEGGEMPEGMERPEGGEMPEGMEVPEGGEMPEGMERPEGGRINRDELESAEVSTEFVVVAGGSYFDNVAASK